MRSRMQAHKAVPKASPPRVAPRVAVLPLGTRGDHQPFIPLAQALVAKGCAVEFWCFGERQVEFVQSFGLDAVVYEGVPCLTMLIERYPKVRELFRDGKFVAMAKLAAELMAKHDAQLLSQLLSHFDRFQPDYIVHSQLMQSLALWLHDLRGGTPFCLMQLYPRAPTRYEAPYPFAAVGIDLPCGANWVLHTHFLRVLHARVLDKEHVYAQERRRAGLSPMTVRDIEETFESQDSICAWSPRVFDGYADWSAKHKPTGYLTLLLERQIDAFTPDETLRAFVAQKPKPVYIGWGSMIVGDAASQTRLALQAAHLAGVRAVIVGGWAKLSIETLDEETDGQLKRYAASNVLIVDYPVPHEWLMPQCSAAVSHGGAGTTGAILRSGTPAIITPVISDQFFWAKRVRQLGVGHGFTTTLSKTSAQDIAHAIMSCTRNDVIQHMAAILGEALRKEDGVANAASFVYERAAKAAVAKQNAIARSA